MPNTSLHTGTYPVVGPDEDEAPTPTVDSYLSNTSVRQFLNVFLASLLRDRPVDLATYSQRHMEVVMRNNDAAATTIGAAGAGGGNRPSRSTSLTVSPMVLPCSSPPLSPATMMGAALLLPPPSTRGGGVAYPSTNNSFTPSSTTRSPYTLPRKQLASSITTTPPSFVVPPVLKSCLPYPSSMPLPPTKDPAHHQQQQQQHPTGAPSTYSQAVVTPKLTSFVDRKRTEALINREFDWLQLVGSSLAPNLPPKLAMERSDAGCQTDEDGVVVGGRMGVVNYSSSTDPMGTGMGSVTATKEFAGSTEEGEGEGGDEEEEGRQADEEVKPPPPAPSPKQLARQFPTPQSYYSLIDPNGGRNGCSGSSKKKGGSNPPSSSPTSPLDIRNAEFSGEGNYGSVVKGFWAPHAPPEVSNCDSSSSSGGGALAMKVVPVVSKWSLDEVAALRRCSKAAEDVQRGPIDGLSHLQYQVAKAGASAVVLLQGPCCYDPKKNTIWLPLPWMPLTLSGWITHRQKKFTVRSGSNSRHKVGSAAAIAATDGSLPSLFRIDEIRSVARQMLCAVHFLSEYVGLAHLDIKPANVLLKGGSYDELDRVSASTGGRGVDIGVCDYGLAQSIGGELQQLGDYSYMAPEVFWCDETTGFTSEGCEVDADPTNAMDLAARVSDARAKKKATSSSKNHAEMNTFQEAHDVWSIGCVVLYLLDGCAATIWEAEDYFGALRDSFLTPFPRHPSRWPSELLHLLALMLEKDPRRRPSAYELLSTHPFFTR